jgi:hypothetical protein
MAIHDRWSFPHLGFVRPLAVGSDAVLTVLVALQAPHRVTGTADGPVYTVATLRAHLVQQPAAWVDRPLRVRALAEACSTWLGSVAASPCIEAQPVLADPASTGAPLLDAAPDSR